MTKILNFNESNNYSINTNTINDNSELLNETEELNCENLSFQANSSTDSVSSKVLNSSSSLNSNQISSDATAIDLMKNISSPEPINSIELNPPLHSKYQTELHPALDQFIIPNIVNNSTNYLKVVVRRFEEDPKEKEMTKNSCPNPVNFNITPNGDCQITKSVLQTTVNQVRNQLKNFHVNGIDWYDALLEITKVTNFGLEVTYNIVFSELTTGFQKIVSSNIILTGCDIMYPGTFSPTVVTLNGLLNSELISDLDLMEMDKPNVGESVNIALARCAIVQTKKGFRNKISHFDFDIPCNKEQNLVRYISNDNFEEQIFVYKLEHYLTFEQKVFYGVKIKEKQKNLNKQRIRKGNAKKRSKCKTTLEHEAIIKQRSGIQNKRTLANKNSYTDALPQIINEVVSIETNLNTSQVDTYNTNICMNNINTNNELQSENYYNTNLINDFDLAEKIIFESMSSISDIFDMSISNSSCQYSL